jgi:hypothetical protein
MEMSLPLLLGLGTVAAVLWGRNRRPSNAVGEALPEGISPAASTTPLARSGQAPFQALLGKWVFPVPITHGRVPVISSGWGSPRGDRQHEGVDVMFRRLPSDPFPVHSPHGSKLFVMPGDVLAVAAADGVLWFAGDTARGWSVVIDHTEGTGQKVASYYTHMDRLFVPPTSRGRGRIKVTAGQPLGIIGADPLDGNHLMHLHFALWAGGSENAFDAAPFMAKWEKIKDPRESGPPSAPSTSSSGATPRTTGGAAGGSSAVANPSTSSAAGGDRGPFGSLVAASLAPTGTSTHRNGRLVFRPLGRSGERYPEWVHELRGKSGVYFIRERASNKEPGELVYIGQSQANRLYETLTRHFQTWRRWKGFWRGQYAEGHDPGLTYPRDQVEVAVRVTPPERALEQEARYIQRLRPRDNVIGQLDELAAVPF